MTDYHLSKNTSIVLSKFHLSIVISLSIADIFHPPLLTRFNTLLR